MTEAVDEVERGLVLGQSAGGVVPCSGVSTGGPRLKHADDALGLFEARDTGANPEVGAKLVRDLVELGFDVWASGEHRRGLAIPAVELGDRRAGSVEMLLGVVQPMGQIGESAMGGLELVLVASAS